MYSFAWADIQGFDAASIQQIEAQFVERFLEQSDFYLPEPSRSYSRGSQRTDNYSCPLDESTLFRLIRLLDDPD